MTPTGQTPASRRKLGEILVEAGVVDELQLRSALGHQRQWGGRLGNILIDLHFIDDVTLASTLAKQLALDLVDLSTAAVDLEVVRLVPQTVAERHNIFPLEVDASRQKLTIAFSDPTNLAAIDEVRFQTGKTIGIAVAPEGQIAQAIRRYYTEEPTVTDRTVEPAALFGNVDRFLASDEEDLAELEPIPSDSQISLNLRDIGMSPVPFDPSKPVPVDPMAGFFQGASAAAMTSTPAPSSPSRLPQALRLGPPPPEPEPPRGPPPVLNRPEALPPSPRRASDFLAQAVDLSKKTVEGFVPPPDLLRSKSSTQLPVSEAPSPGTVPPLAAPNFTDSDFGRALEGLDHPATADTLQTLAADGDPRLVEALALLLIEKGLIAEAELLAKLAKD